MFLFSFIRKPIDDLRNVKITYYSNNIVRNLKLTDKRNNTHLDINFYQNGFLKNFVQFSKYKTDEKTGNVFSEFQRLSLDSTGSIISHTFMKDFKIISEGNLKNNKYTIKRCK